MGLYVGLHFILRHHYAICRIHLNYALDPVNSHKMGAEGFPRRFLEVRLPPATVSSRHLFK